MGARVLQGVGAALVVRTLATLTGAFAGRARGRAMGSGLRSARSGSRWVPRPAGCSPARRLALDLLGQRPGGAARAAHRPACDRREPRLLRRLGVDLGGVASSGAGLLALTYALIEANRLGWRSPAILGLFAAAAIALRCSFVTNCGGTSRCSTSGSSAGPVRGRERLLVLAGFGLFGVFFFLSLYLQGIVGLSAVQGGLAFTPLAAVLVVAAPLSAQLAGRFGAHRVVASGMLLFGIGLALISRVDAGSHYLDVLPGLLVAALGSALTTPLTTAVLASVPAEKAGVASGALNTSRELAGALGIAVMGAILAGRQSSALAHGATPAEAFVSGYSLALAIAAGVMVAGALLAATLLAKRRPGLGAAVLDAGM